MLFIGGFQASMLMIKNKRKIGVGNILLGTYKLLKNLIQNAAQLVFMCFGS